MSMTSASILPRCRRLTAIGVTCLTLFGGAASAQTPAQAAPGASAACEKWAILSTAGQASGRVEVCSRVLQDVPRLREQIAYLNQRAVNDADARRDLQRFAQTLNQMARQLKGQDVQRMADSLVARLEKSRREGDSALMEELDHLRLGMREVQRTLQDMRESAATKDKVDPALSGKVGASIAQFDFDTAKGILGQLGRIETTVNNVDRNIERMLNPAEARVLIAADRRRATQQIERFEQAGAEKRCNVVYRELLPVLAASKQAEREGDFNTARSLVIFVWSQAAQATNELQTIDMQKSQDAAMRADEENALARGIVESQRRLEQYRSEVKSQEESVASARENQRNALQERESTFHSWVTQDALMLTEARGRLAGPRGELRDAESLPQANEEQRQRRKVAIEQARARLQHAEQQFANVEADAVKRRADFEQERKGESWPTAPDGHMVKDIAYQLERLRLVQAARDHLDKAVVKAIREGKDDPAKAAEDLRAAEDESSEIMNGQIPMPRRRSTRVAAPVMPNTMCV